MTLGGTTTAINADQAAAKLEELAETWQDRYPAERLRTPGPPTSYRTAPTFSPSADGAEPRLAVR